MTKESIGYLPGQDPGDMQANEEYQQALDVRNQRAVVREEERSVPVLDVAVVRQVQDIGTYWLVSCDAAGSPLKVRLAPDVVPPAAGDVVGLQLLGENTCFYQNEELVP